MKILFYTNIPSPYRVDFFNELGKFCDLTVLFETDNSTERDEIWKEYKFEHFNGVILKGKRTGRDSAFCPGIVSYLSKKYDYIVVTQLASLTAIWAVAYMRLRRIKYCYEGDSGFVNRKKSVKTFLKRMIIGNAEFCMSTSELFDEYCKAYGAREDRIYRYPLTSVKECDVLKKCLSRVEKEKIRERLNISEEKMVLSVGQFIHRKGFDILIEVAKTLSSEIGIYIIGGKPTAEYLELKERWNLEQVHFVEFMKKEELLQYYQAADLFVFPTREDIWGLVINEAMANGLPVISTDRCIAALEMVERGKNGYIVSANNVDEMRIAIQSVIESEELQDEMSRTALNVVNENYTIEKMAQRHMEIFKRKGE